MIKVYQIALTGAEVGEINSKSWEDLEPNSRLAAYRDRHFEHTFKSFNFRFYDHVANVDAESLESAFALMNLWSKPELVEKINPNTVSMSVGDIVEKDDILYRVASFGFTELN